MKQPKYGKVRFVDNYNGETAGIILTDTQQQDMTISEIGALFPYSEATKMTRLERSKYFDTFNEAFYYNFDIQEGLYND